MTNHTQSKASPAFVAIAELDLACTYALRRPKLAIECAFASLGAAHRAGRMDLADRANEFLIAMEATITEGK